MVWICLTELLYHKSGEKSVIYIQKNAVVIGYFRLLQSAIKNDNKGELSMGKNEQITISENENDEQEIQLFRYTALNNSDYKGIEIYTIENDTEFKSALETFDKLMSANN